MAAALPLSVAGVDVPQTPLAREAASIAHAAEPIEIFNHSLRTFLFAGLLAKRRGIAHDPDLLFVASILHDTGLSRAYMSNEERFEVDGANLARRVLHRHGVSGFRAGIVWDAIALHDSGGIARWKQAEVALASAGVSADFGGSIEELRREDVVAVLHAAPRTNFIEVFLDAVAVVAARKPQATGGCFVTDVGYRRVPGFHLANFCDEVRSDPFKGYE